MTSTQVIKCTRHGQQWAKLPSVNQSVVPVGLPLAKIGSASGRIAGVEMQMRGAFDLEVRRKPQAFAAGAVILAGIMDFEYGLGTGQVRQKALIGNDDDGSWSLP